MTSHPGMLLGPSAPFAVSPQSYWHHGDDSATALTKSVLTHLNMLFTLTASFKRHPEGGSHQKLCCNGTRDRLALTRSRFAFGLSSAVYVLKPALE